MPLEPIDPDITPAPLPPAEAALVAEAERRIDAFFKSGASRALPRYLPSDPALVRAALEAVTSAGLPTGRVFVEWGCGFGVATGLAALLGYDAYGIEIEPELAARARSLLADHGLPPRVLCANFVPEGLETYDGQDGPALVDTPSPAPPPGGWGYSGPAPALDETDVIFAYPWPGEQSLVIELFDTVAAEGTLLLAYYGHGDLTIYQKLADDDDEEEEDDDENDREDDDE